MADEKPILIGYLHTTDAYTYYDSGVPREQKPFLLSDMWGDYELIPTTAPAPTAWPGVG